MAADDDGKKEGERERWFSGPLVALQRSQSMGDSSDPVTRFDFKRKGKEERDPSRIASEEEDDDDDDDDR